MGCIVVNVINQMDGFFGDSDEFEEMEAQGLYGKIRDIPSPAFDAEGPMPTGILDTVVFLPRKPEKGLKEAKPDRCNR